MMAVLFFIIKAYLVVLVISIVFAGVAAVIQGTLQLLRLDPHDNKVACFTITWIMTGGFLYLVGHFISSILNYTPVISH
jgi:hypothetical protein